ncbi:hypothetical protein CMV_009646 [Castanea mollissima]|uniref:DCC family protein n=1 Tax=Castanea mollissima TaxID=60419 RepID=A0A8J4R6T4_9ROSI|nr:hypothetical protein CMV_009646 [Castanea mollissima]
MLQLFQLRVMDISYWIAMVGTIRCQEMFIIYDECNFVTLCISLARYEKKGIHCNYEKLLGPGPGPGPGRVGSQSMEWVEATSSFFQQDSRPIMLFDGVCNLCNGGVKFVRENDRNRSIRFEPLQSEAGKKLLQRSGRAPDDISSVVLVEKDRSYIKSEAVLKIMEYIDLPFPQLALFLQFVPLFLRDFLYDNVANNRYTFFGRSESCEI